MIHCPNCGEENPDRFRLCGFCGSPLVADAPSLEERRTVTVVFCDLKGSTDLGERLDPEALRAVLNIYFEEMSDVLVRHGGVVEKYIGDAIMAVFGIPRAHEDDALRAVRATDEMRSTLVRVNEQLSDRFGVTLENRTGVTTGEVVAGDMSKGLRLITGDTVNTAARLEQAAPPSDVLIGEPTYRLARDAIEVEVVEPLELKGKSERIPAYRLISVRGGEGYARRIDLPMVGRAAELGILRSALARARASGSCRLVTVLAPAGTGKSRLVRELRSVESDSARFLFGRCLPYGDDITYWPIADIARMAADIVEDDPLTVAQQKLASTVPPDAQDVIERLAAAIGLSRGQFGAEETGWAIRRFFELLASDRPLVVVIDDIHWAEQTLLDLLVQLTEEMDAPVLLVCTTRTELIQEHEGWPLDGPVSDAIGLAPLSAAEVSEIAANLLGSSGIDARVIGRVIGSAEGNPLFVEQLLSMLVDDGTLVHGDGDRWVASRPIDDLDVPPTIAALLTARLDRLGSADQTTIERASVIGQEFEQDAVAHLLPEALRPGLDESLRSVTAKELIRPDDRKTISPAYVFVHGLVRDAAYRRLLKATRAELHARFVDWVEETFPDRTTEFEEIRGHHLEQAFLIRRALGTPDDPELVKLGERAAAHLRSAGRRAIDRGDMPAAGGLFRRAAALLPFDPGARIDLLVDGGDALIETGDLIGAATCLEEAVALAGEDPRRSATARLALLRLRAQTEGVSETQIFEAVETALPALEAAEDHAGIARAWRLVLQVHWEAGRYGEAEIVARRMIEEASAAGDAVTVRRVTPALAICSLYGPTPVAEAIERCEGLLVTSVGDRKAEAILLVSLAHLQAMQGLFDAARERYRKSRALLEEPGWRFLAALTSIDSGNVEMLAGDPVAAEAELRSDYDTLEEMGERNYISTVAGLLAEALHQQGRYEDAMTFVAVCREVAADDDVASQTLWRNVNGKVLAHRGAVDAGVALIEEAVDLARTTDDIDARAWILLDLARVLGQTDRTDEAAAAAIEAAELFETKGDLIGIRSARLHLSDATG